MNLLVNARDAIEKGGTLTIRTDRPDKETVRIIVADTGPGIAPDDMDRIFDPFFTTKEAGHGTGLGLSVSQRIIESFYGDIRITSGPNESTRVRIRMPVLEQDEDTPQSPVREEMPQHGTTVAHRG